MAITKKIRKRPLSKRKYFLTKKIKEEEILYYENAPIKFIKDEKIIIKTENGNSIESFIKRVNKKTYTVVEIGSSGDKYNKYRIDKHSLVGYPDYLYTEAQNIGSRKWIGMLSRISIKDKNLYIDDIRTPKNKFDIITRSSKETIKLMRNYGCPSFISFDHDLGGEDTSMIIIKWMVEHDMNLREKGKSFIPNDFSFNVHSANPVGAKNIEGYLKSYLKSLLTTEGDILEMS